MASLFKPGLVFLRAESLAEVKTEINVGVEESKEGCLEEPDPPTVVPAPGCCSVTELVRSRMRGIDRTGYWRQRKFIVSFVFGVSGGNIPEVE